MESAEAQTERVVTLSQFCPFLAESVLLPRCYAEISSMVICVCPSSGSLKVLEEDSLLSCFGFLYQIGFKLQGFISSMVIPVTQIDTFLGKTSKQQRDGLM